jgi:formate dehydrogenase iron-sulfur subunit
MSRGANPNAEECVISRRAFMKRTGLGAAVVAASMATAAVGVETKTAAASAGSEAGASEDAVGMLIDTTRCTGCQACALACKEANRMPEPETVPERLSSSALSFVDTRKLSDEDQVFVKRQCMQCVHPACASACTVGALRKTAEGPVIYDSGKCIGCRYCQYACPFGVPTYEWGNVFGLIQKCQFCFQRVAEGEQPACVAACPNGALQFGKRSMLLAQAHASISSNPDRYVDKVYGEHEVGGTSMLYLSAVPFQALGLPALGDAPASHYAETVMELTPAVALTVATIATGLHFITRRRKPIAFTPDHDDPAQADENPHGASGDHAAR